MTPGEVDAADGPWPPGHQADDPEEARPEQPGYAMFSGRTGSSMHAQALTARVGGETFDAVCGEDAIGGDRR